MRVAFVSILVFIALGLAACIAIGLVRR